MENEKDKIEVIKSGKMEDIFRQRDHWPYQCSADRILRQRRSPFSHDG